MRRVRPRRATGAEPGRSIAVVGALALRLSGVAAADATVGALPAALGIVPAALGIVPAALGIVPAALGIVAATASGCAPHVTHPETAQGLPGIEPRPIEDRDFAEHLHAVLRGAEKNAAALRLGVVKQQLSHASTRFDGGAEDRGLRSVLGAFYLMREGDSAGVLADAATARALDGTVRRVSARGDLGKARALLGLVLGARKSGRLPGSVEETEAHIADLDRWVNETRRGSPIEKAGEAERAAVSRVLVDPSSSALEEASTAISSWIDLAIEHNISFRQTGRRPTQEEAIESTRALESGSATLVAMYLRLGDLEGALAQIESSSVRRVIDPDFYRVLKTASQTNDGRAWKTIFSELDRQTSDKVGGEVGVDEELLDAAFFNVALEAYRRDSSDLPTALELSRSLTTYGMSEGVPLVLGDALGESPKPNDAAAAAERVSAALRADADAGDWAAAARTIAASSRLLAIGDKATEKTGGLSALRQQIAGIQIHAGDLKAARDNLEIATRQAPSAAGLTTLALVARQLGDGKAALELATRAADFRGADPLEEADASLLVFEIERGAGRKAEAAAALERALKATVRARNQHLTAAYRVKVERTLGRVLLSYGETAAAGRAFDRALDQVSGDRALIGGTLLRSMMFCLLTRDARRGRVVLKKGREAGADDEDLVYAALWLGLLEKQTHASSDGSTTEIFESAQGSGAWVGRLAMWGLGKLGDAELEAQAQTPSAKVEAAFYVAMKKRAAGSTDDAILRSVAASPVVDLLEVDLARELTSEPLKLSFPKGIGAP
jgi:tetratricopeptide (TPR) repeat protein